MGESADRLHSRPCRRGGAAKLPKVELDHTGEPADRLPGRAEGAAHALVSQVDLGGGVLRQQLVHVQVLGNSEPQRRRRRDQVWVPLGHIPDGSREGD
eukprot:7178321-Pyramimonas_sp.AAC.1